MFLLHAARFGPDRSSRSAPAMSYSLAAGMPVLDCGVWLADPRGPLSKLLLCPLCTSTLLVLNVLLPKPKLVWFCAQERSPWMQTSLLQLSQKPPRELL